MAAKPDGVVVTGTSSGIGEVCALSLDKLGYRVFAGVRKESDGEALKRKASARLTAVKLDVTEASQVSASAASVAAALGGQGLAGLVNNAGVVVGGPLECIPIPELQEQLEVNVIGQLLVTQALLPLLRQGRGRIVMIGSIAGRSAVPFMGAYAASKFALEGLTDSLRTELAPWSIHVAIVEPGSIATPIWEKSAARAAAQARGLSLRAQQLYGGTFTAMREAARKAAQRAIPPERVVKAVIHALTSKRPKTRYLVGTDARARLLLELLPDRLRDKLILQALGLPKKA